MQKHVHFIKRGKKWALAEISGKRLTPFVFDGVLPFVREIGIGFIERFGAFFLSELGGKRLFRQAFDSVEYVPGPWYTGPNKDTPVGYKVVHKGKTCVLDFDLNVIVPWGAYRVDGPYQGIYTLCDNRIQYGFAGYGRIIVPCDFDQVRNFCNGYAPAKKKKWGLIDSWGNCVVPFVYDSLGYAVIEGVIDATRDGKAGFVDPRGVEVIPFKFKTTWPFDHGYARVEMFDGRHCTIDHSGEVVENVGERMSVPLELVSKHVSISIAATVARKQILMRQRFNKLKGRTFEALRSVSIDYITWFAAPCSLSGKDRLPKGTRFTLRQLMRDDAYYCDIDNEEELTRICEKERKYTDTHLPRLKGRFNGISIFLTESDILTSGNFRQLRCKRALTKEP